MFVAGSRTKSHMMEDVTSQWKGNKKRRRKGPVRSHGCVRVGSRPANHTFPVIFFLHSG
ncbi:hypothetical protein ASPFODRAFT_255121 [Aspergillus luchuensis CBS 106.47]|uniref:Uncharacterized protein n=1 Tax=Aspergillus luchuensis (strain CBS 106.47) TaxID=1137211 RepID=A0A1M3U034_ASPLC|nr:hypothetical protein ASPFODRAFT_255121 [Aspergillus luchuensis CBS 106.47]